MAEQVFDRKRTSKLPPSLRRTALRKLTMVDAAVVIDDLRVPPGNKLEHLKGNRSRQYSVRINNQWRICFEFYDGNAYNIEIVDYH